MSLAGGAAGAQAISLLVYPILTRLYGTEAFGILSVYTAAVGLVSMVSTLRYDMAVPLPDSRQHALSVATFALYANFSVSFVFLLVGMVFPSALDVLGLGEIPTYFVWLIPAGIFLGGTYKVMSMWAVRERAYSVIATTRVTQTLGTTGLQLGLGTVRATGSSLVVSHMLGSGIGIGSVYARTIRGRGYRYPSWNETLAAGKQYWHFAAMGAPATLFNSVAINTPAILISSFYGVAATGQFGLAMRVVGVPITLLGNSVEAAFFAEAARIGRENATKIKSMVDLLTIRLVGAGVVPTIVLIVWGPWLFEVVFGAEWHLAGVFASYLAVLMFFNILSTPFSSVFMIYDKLHLALVLDVLKMILAIGAFVFPHLLGWDAAAATLTYALALGCFYLVFGLTARQVLSTQVRDQRDNDLPENAQS